MPAEKDPFWKYAEVVDPGKKWRCKFCQVEYAGKAPRIKAHLANVPGKGIKPCKSVDETTKNEAKRALLNDTSNEEGHLDRGPESSSKRQRSSDQSGFAVEMPKTNSQEGQHGIMMAPSCNAPITSQPIPNNIVSDQLGECSAAAGQAETPNGEIEGTDISLSVDVLGEPDQGAEAFLSIHPFGKEFKDEADGTWNHIIEMYAGYGDRLDMEKKDFIGRKLSYDRLTPEIKQCLLRCALYPYGGIERSDLIELFIDDGLIFGPYDRWTMYEKGHRILDALIDVDLLEKASEDTVRMHRLIRVMAIYVMRASPRAMIQAGLELDDAPNAACWPRDVQMVSLMKNKIGEFPMNYVLPYCPQLSMLLLNGNDMLQTIPESFFEPLPGLKVLDMSHTMMRKLPGSISKLVKLEVLLLRGCKRLSYIPSLAKMTSLRKLDLCGCEALETEPLGLEVLVNITYLDLSGTRIQTLPKLEKIQYLGYDKEVDVEDLHDLQFLRSSTSNWVHLNSILTEFVVRDYDDDDWTAHMFYVFMEEKEESVFPNSNDDDDDDWAVKWSRKSSPCGLGTGNIEKRFIRISGPACDEFSLDLDSMLEELEYNEKFCKRPTVIVIYRRTQSGDLILEGLVLHSCPALDYAFAATTTSVSLEYLEELYLPECENMEGIIAPTLQIPPNTLHRLTRIYVDSCPEIGILLPAALLPHLGKLREISVYSCDEMGEIFQLDPDVSSDVVLGSLEEIYVRDCHNLTRLLPAALLPHLGKLRKISVYSCGKMGDIIQLDPDVSSDVVLGSLEEIHVSDCHNLTRLLPAALLPHLGKLRRIYVGSCGEMGDIFQLDPDVSSDVVLGSLEVITVRDCNNLRRLLPAALLPHLGKLRRIYVGFCDEMGDIFQLDRTVLSGIHLTSLVEIEVWHCDNLARLFPPELLKHLQQLERITVSKCKGMKEVIGYGNGSKTRGETSNLPLFPSPLSLPHLTSLRLVSLPQLEKICGGTLTGCTFSSTGHIVSISECPNLEASNGCYNYQYM